MTPSQPAATSGRAVPEPRHAARRADRDARARARLREPRPPPRRGRPDPPRVAGEALDLVPARVPRARTARAGRCRRAATPACSSSTRRPRSPPGTARAPSAAARTTSASWRSSARNGRTTSTSASTRSGSARGRVRVASLPDGAFVLVDGEPWLVLGGELLRWTPGGYTDRRQAAGTRCCSRRRRCYRCSTRAGAASFRFSTRTVYGPRR